jgi:cyclophilin family peptidyl-prolyl cis-trans isomerase
MMKRLAETRVAFGRGCDTMRTAMTMLPKSMLLTLAMAGLLAQSPNRALLEKPDDPEMNRRAPDASRVELETSKGRILLEMRREWSPHGVDRFYNLVRHGYYDEARVFRIRAKTWAQFGVAADPKISTIWRTRNIPDDKRVLSNARGTLAYAFKDANGRTTQMFFNLMDNQATHDAPADGNPFVPFARVLEGMEAADAFYADYGETAGGGIRGGKQDILFKEGNAFFLREFPKLDYIKVARVVN